ncbi:MAG: hypothetical protein JSS89_13150 [Bacteroidetes bacterium]|nr:hypothetical protein [Bacteroidota bacterium]
MSDFVNIQLRRITCCNCGVVFAIGEDHVQQLKEKGSTFYCPSGHGQYFDKVDPCEKSKRRIAELNEQLDAAAKKIRELERGNRCEHCGKRYKNLIRHIQKQHSEQLTEKANA